MNPTRILFVSGARPTTSSFYTGNPAYFTLLAQTNALMRKHALPFTAQPPQTRIITLQDLASLYKMRLNEDSYAVLAHNLKSLAGVDDVDVQSVVGRFLRGGKGVSEEEMKDGEVVDYKCTAVASRKSARANVVVSKGTGVVYINGTPLQEYFYEKKDKIACVKPLVLANRLAKYNVWAVVDGGGFSSQAESVGVAVARVKHEVAFKEAFEEEGLCQIDTRQKERKKTGLRGARTRYRWTKR